MSKAFEYPVTTFRTARLDVRVWTEQMRDARQRLALERALTALLTPPVLEHLPEPLHLTGAEHAVSDWMQARHAESAVFTIRSTDSGALMGLLILAQGGDEAGVPVFHLGYLFAEVTWGKGYATELVSGLAAACGAWPRCVLIGGVGTDNQASARVLEKAGFERHPEGATQDTEMFVRRLP